MLVPQGDAPCGKSALHLVGETDLQGVTVNGDARFMLERSGRQREYHSRGRHGAGQVSPSDDWDQLMWVCIRCEWRDIQVCWVANDKLSKPPRGADSL